MTVNSAFSEPRLTTVLEVLELLNPLPVPLEFARDVVEERNGSVPRSWLRAANETIQHRRPFIIKDDYIYRSPFGFFEESRTTGFDDAFLAAVANVLLRWRPSDASRIALLPLCRFFCEAVSRFVTFAQNRVDTAQLLTLMIHAAELSARQGRPFAADTMLRSIEQVEAALLASSVTSRVLLTRALVALSLEDPDQAVAYGISARRAELEASHQDLDLIADTHRILISAHLLTGDLESAVAEHDEFQDFWKGSGSVERIQSELLLQSALIGLEHGEFDESKAFLLRSIRLDFDPDPSPRLATLERYNALALTEIALGRPAEAIDILDPIIEVVHEASDEPLLELALLYSARADAYGSLGVDAKPEADLRVAIEITERVLGPINPRLSFRRGKLGAIYEARGQFGDAIAEYDRALQAFPDSSSRVDARRLRILLKIASVSVLLRRDMQVALSGLGVAKSSQLALTRAYAKLIRSALKTKDPVLLAESTALSSYCSDFELGRRCLERAQMVLPTYSVDRRIVAQTALSFGEQCRNSGEFQIAVEAFAASAQLAGSDLELRALAERGRGETQELFAPIEDAIESYRLAAETFSRAGRPQLQLDVAMRLAVLQSTLGADRQAEQVLDSCLALIEQTPWIDASPYVRDTVSVVCSTTWGPRSSDRMHRFLSLLERGGSTREMSAGALSRAYVLTEAGVELEPDERAHFRSELRRQLERIYLIGLDDLDPDLCLECAEIATEAGELEVAGNALSAVEWILGTTHNKASSREFLALAWHSLGRTSEADGRYESALQAYERTTLLVEDTSQQLGVIFHDIGDVKVALGDITGARDAYEAAAHEKRKLGTSTSQLSVTLLSLGRMSFQLGDNGRAQSVFQERLNLLEAEQRPDAVGIAVTLHDLAEIESVKGNWTVAKDLFARAAALKQEGSSVDDLFFTLINLLSNALWAKDLVHAETALAECERLLGQVNDKDMLWRYHYFGSHYRCLAKELELALDASNAAVRVALELDNSDVLLLTMIDKGHLELTLGMYEDARNSARVADAVMRDLGDVRSTHLRMLALLMSLLHTQQELSSKPVESLRLIEGLERLDERLQAADQSSELLVARSFVARCLSKLEFALELCDTVLARDLSDATRFSHPTYEAMIFKSEVLLDLGAVEQAGATAESAVRLATLTNPRPTYQSARGLVAQLLANAWVGDPASAQDPLPLLVEEIETLMARDPWAAVRVVTRPAFSKALQTRWSRSVAPTMVTERLVRCLEELLSEQHPTRQELGLLASLRQPGAPAES